MSGMKTRNSFDVKAKYLLLRFAVTVGSFLDQWKVVWAGGWDKGHIFFLVMVERRI
jgi:hypothetical protein